MSALSKVAKMLAKAADKGLGLTDEVLDEQEPEGYAAGGLVKKLSKALIKGVEDFQAGKNSIRDIEIYKNPSYRDALGIAEEDGNFALRTLYDKVGDDVYVWPADQTLHDSIIRAWLMNAESGMKRHPSDFDRGLFELQGKKFVVPKDANVNPDRVDPAFWFKSRFEPEEYASGGLVKAGGKVAKKGAAALEELLENMRKADPERLKRAEEAGYDTSKIWLHGTNTDELINDGAFNHDKRVWTKYATDPELKGFYFSDDPMTAGHYASYYPMAREGETYEESVLRHQPFYLPVFLKNNKIVADDGGRISNLYEGIDWPVEHTIAYDPKDIRSIFNDFTPESLASEKFASGGLVYPYD